MEKQDKKETSNLVKLVRGITLTALALLPISGCYEGSYIIHRTTPNRIYTYPSSHYQRYFTYPQTHFRTPNRHFRTPNRHFNNGPYGKIIISLQVS